MTNVEKIISDLEQGLDDSVVAVVPADTVREAIAMLKAQEPVEPTEPDEDNMRYCGACGSPVGYEVLVAPGIEYVQYNYCPNCGRAVKWDG